MRIQGIFHALLAFIEQCNIGENEKQKEFIKLAGVFVAFNDLKISMRVVIVSDNNLS